MLRPLVITALCAGLIAAAPALACTDVRLVATDGSPFTVRTMEFAMDLQSEAVIVHSAGVRSPRPLPTATASRGHRSTATCS